MKLAALAVAAILLSAQPRNYPLTSTAGLRLHDVSAALAEWNGKTGLRAIVSAKEYTQGLLSIDNLDFANGVIEAEIAGDLAPNAGAEARGFVGIAFRIQPDRKAYDAFYIRPTNGRAVEQERRNHATQYISLPDRTWSRLRKETPGRYESYVDLVPGAWTKIKIEVQGEHARLYVHGNEQPTLIVQDLKSGPTGHGGVALWLEPGTVAHFRNLTITPVPK